MTAPAMLPPALRSLPYLPPPDAALSNGQSAFTGEKLERRKKTLGASEIAAVAGLSSYESALDIYLRKTGVVPAFAGNEYTEWGNRLEDLIAQKYADVMGVKVQRVGTFVRDWMSATPDRLAEAMGPVITDYWGVECKNKSARMAHLFGETGTDQVPDDVAAQCYWGMIVTTLPWWDVPVLIGGNEFRWFRLHRDDEIESVLQERGHDFWHNNVLKGIEPPVDGSQSWSEHLKRKFSKHSEQLRDATEDESAWMLDLFALRHAKEQLEEKEDLLENQIKGAIGESAGLTSPYGRITWKSAKHGNPKWKEIAEVLGATPEIIEANRGAAARKFLVTPAKESV